MTTTVEASSYVGFDSITRQIEHKLLKRGFQFNVMVVGSPNPCQSQSDPLQDLLQDKQDWESRR